MTIQTYQENPISLGKAEKKYKIPHTTLSYWAKTGRLKVLQRPERKGQVLLVDEASVVLALQKAGKFPAVSPAYPYPPAPAFSPQAPPVPEYQTKELIDQFLKAKRMSPDTIRWYQGLLIPFAKQYPIYPQEPQPFRDFIVNLPSHLSPQRQYNYWNALRAFARWCYREYDLPDYFSLSAKKRIEPPYSLQQRLPKPRTLTDLEIVRLFEIADNFLDKLLLKTFISTGIRSGELRSLTSERIFPDHIQVKGKTGERRVDIMPDLYTNLMLLAAEVPPGEPIFRDRDGKPMGQSGVYQRVEKCMRLAGITGKKVGPHVLRHTFGRITQRDGGDLVALQKMLGHTQITTTRIYAELADEDVTKKYKESAPHRLLNGKGKGNEG